MTHPSINDAVKLAKRDGKTGVVIFHYDEKNNDFGFTSYGADKSRHRDMWKFGKQVFDAVMRGKITVTYERECLLVAKFMTALRKFREGYSMESRVDQEGL